MRLPNVEKRWQLRFSSYDEEEESRDLTQRRVRTRPREREYRAGFIFFERLGNIKTTFQPQIQLKDPLEMKYNLRFDSDAKRRTLKLKPRFELFADPNKGTGQYFSIELSFNITEKLDVVFHNSEEYQDYRNLFTVQHGVSIDQSLSDSQAAGLAITSGSINRPSYHLETLTISTSYAKEVMKKVLTYSLSPYLSFSKTRHFKGESGLTLNVEVIF